MNNLKKLVCLALVGTSIASTSLVAFAATTDFNVTVGNSSTDTKSKRTLKAGGSSYENKFYVTVNSMTPSGMNVYVSSHILEGPITSNEILVNSGTRGASASYRNTTAAPYEVYYYMDSRMSGPGGDANMTGRYTP